MKKIQELIRCYVLSDAIPLEARLLNITYLCGMIFASVALVTRSIIGANPYLLLVILGIILSSTCLIYISNRFHLYNLCIQITIVFICDILLPAAYFFLGGVAGSSVAYFILSVMIIFLLSHGKSCLIFLSTHIILVITCYYISYRYPDLVIPLDDTAGASRDIHIYLDHIQSFLVVGICIGLIVKFQNIIYLIEKDKKDVSHQEIFQQNKLRQAVNQAAAVLLAPEMDEFNDSILKSMDILARSVDVDRMFLWKSRKTAGIIHHVVIFQWAGDPKWRVHDMRGLFFTISEDTPLDKPFNGPLSSFPQNIQNGVAPYGTVSSLAIPITLQGRLWGFVSFDDCHRKRHFSALEEEILRSGVMMLADAMIRNEITQSLIRVKEEALAGTKAKSEFLARMSHEIRTPLNAILGLSEVELGNNLPDGTRINLEKIYGSGSLLLEIVNDILDISKIGSGNFELFPAGYEVPSLINDTIQLNIMRIGSKPVEFKLELDETIPSRLCGDEVRVKQILNNLLSNAFKYTEEGEVRLCVTWKREGDDARLTFIVKDTGRGIKKEDLEKLFSEYTQFDTTANRRIEGTGLGLSITRGLVEKMSGNITVESEYGKGTVFRATLLQGILDGRPIDAETAENLRHFRFIEDRSRSRGNTLIRSWMPYGKVLVVDDLQTNLDVMTGLLMPYGLQVDTVLSGQEAVERIRGEKVRYDLIFMDHMMPEMDGTEAARDIRNNVDSDYARNVPIIALTANAIAGNREMFLKNGFNDFIAKPIDIKRLDIVLNQWVRDIQNEETLQEAESQARKRAETAGRKGGRDAAGGGKESRWLMEHSVEGVDFDEALRLYGGDGGAFMPILKSFVTHTPSLIDKMDAHLDTSLSEYAVEAHGFKGTCNAICASEAAELAKKLEYASKEGKEDFVKARHGKLRRLALGLTERLKEVVEGWEAYSSSEEKEWRSEPDRELLARLSAATGEFNSNITEEVLGKLEQYRYENDEELIRWLREQAENFDYDSMHRRLEEFLGTT
jgi:signal transduction histidine kinase/FixJ family two-component response regulator/HPt (histidine-containing phosphotransfer) domain-containing protein